MGVQNVRLFQIRTAECAGRMLQALDEKWVSTLKNLLEEGVNFKTKPVVTKDLVLVDGHHRVEGFKRFFSDSYASNRGGLDLVEIPVEVLDITWDSASDMEKSKLFCQAFNLNNYYGKPQMTSDLRHIVIQLLSTKLTASQMKGMLPHVSLRAIEREIKYIKDSVIQSRLSLARQLLKSGVSKVEALREANLPKNTELDTKKSHDLLRLNKIANEVVPVRDRWTRHLNRYKEMYEDGRMTQVQYLNVAAQMKKGASLVIRKAEEADKLISTHINQKAKLRRSVGL